MFAALFSIVVPAMSMANSRFTPPTGMCRNHPGTGFNATNFLLHRRQVPDNAAKCNDGSQAQIYFRPCCNGDDPGDFCNTSTADWFVVFGDGNQEGWCWDAASCAHRVATNPQLVSSVGLPAHFSREGDGDGLGIGAFAKSGEANPNFYKAYAAYVPYCSSDLFLGECNEDTISNNSHVFCGKSIAKAATELVAKEMRKYGADNIVLVGGIGLMTYLEDLISILPQGAKVTAVCDGCVLFDDLPSVGAALSTCKNAFDCTPENTLPDAVDMWGAKLDAACGGWRCLLSTKDQGENGAIARAAKLTPLLAQHPLYDSAAFSARGVKPTSNASFAREVREHVEAGLTYARVVVASACTVPMSSFTRGEFLSVHFGSGLPPPSYATGLYDLVRNATPSKYIDACEGVDCNPDCGPVGNDASYV